MARIVRPTPQEAVLIRGSIIEESDYYWIVDRAGNRMALSWRKDYAEKLADALDTIEEIDEQERRYEERHKS